MWDDFILIENSEDVFKKFKKSIKRDFNMTEFGKMTTTMVLRLYRMQEAY